MELEKEVLNADFTSKAVGQFMQNKNVLYRQAAVIIQVVTVMN